MIPRPVAVLCEDQLKFRWPKKHDGDCLGEPKKDMISNSFGAVPFCDFLFQCLFSCVKKVPGKWIQTKPLFAQYLQP